MWSKIKFFITGSVQPDWNNSSPELMSIVLCESRTYTSVVHSFSYVLQNILVSDLVHQGKMRRKSFSRKLMFSNSVKNTGITYTADHSGSSFFIILCLSDNTVYSDRRLDNVVCYEICSTKVTCKSWVTGRHYSVSWPDICNQDSKCKPLYELSEVQARFYQLDTAVLKAATKAKPLVHNRDDQILLVNTVLQVWFMCQALWLTV
jgi:hypothetical protein